MEAKLAPDDRFYTPRSSARRGYTSGGSEDERFVSPRESARSVSSDENDYGTPRESLATPTAEPHAHPAKYLEDAFRSSKRFPVVSELKHALPEYADSATYEHKLKRSVGAADRLHLGLAPGGSARGPEVHAHAPAIPENDIFSATRHNRMDSVTYMLDQGVSVNAKDEFGNAILSIACQNGLKRMAKLALRRGANINSRNVRRPCPCGCSFLSACGNKKWWFANHTDDGRLLLSLLRPRYCAGRGHREQLRGNTALHFCFAYGYGDTLGAYLISKGADTTIENKDGRVCYYGIDQGSVRK